MKFYLTLGLSALIHIVILTLLSHSDETTIKVKPLPAKAVIQAQLMFSPPAPKLKQKPIAAPEPELKPKPQQLKPEVIVETTKPAAKPQAQTTTKPQITATATSNQPFNARASISSLVNENEQAFFDSIASPQQQTSQFRSINSQNPNAKDQSAIKAIFETAAQIDPDTRVVNYNGTCVQIKRELDHNGFSQFSWLGTTIKCGKDDEMNEQLKLSLSKFLRPKK